MNVSVRTSIEAAEQMGSLADMQALAGEFIALGVMCERSFVNYPLLWETC